jgi:membrane protein YqaA with SNARE-associated domain
VLRLISVLESYVLSLGAGGLFAAALLDSAFLPLPEVVDLCLITLCILNPRAMALYAGVATVASVAGCLMLYYLARSGGHTAAERKAGKERLARIRKWFEKYELLTIIVPAFLPPPVPFKAFVITAGLIEMRVGKLALGLVIGRSIRFLGEGLLAVRFGIAVRHFLIANGALLGAVVTVTVLAAWLLARLLRRESLRRAAGSQSARQ